MIYQLGALILNGWDLMGQAKTSLDTSETLVWGWLLSCACWAAGCFIFLFTVPWDSEDMFLIVKVLTFVWGCGLAGVYLFFFKITK